MKKIEIFVGSDSAFEKIVPKSARNLSEMAAKLDDGNKKMDVFVNIPGQPEPKPKKDTFSLVALNKICGETEI